MYGVQEADSQPVNMAAFKFVEQLSRELNKGNITLPAFPDIAVKVKKVLEDENSSLDQIARVIGTEPALAARVLTMANSAACNRGDKAVLDVRRAISRLGHERIRTLAVSFAMQSMMEQRTVPELKPQMDALWFHSIRVAAIAHSLGNSLPSVDEDEAMFVGLVHDIGKLYILTKIEAHEELFNSPESVEWIMQDWHAEIGCSILSTWGFDTTVVDAVRVHEASDFSKYTDPCLSDVLITANILAKGLENQTLDTLDFAKLPPCRRAGVTAETCDEVLEKAKDEITAMMAALNG